MKLFVVRIIKALTIKGQSFVIALILRCFIKERIGNSKDSFFFAKKSKKKTILALDSKRYRGDLNVLQSTGEFRILHISQGWYGSIIQAFYHKKNYSIVDIISAKKGSNAYHKHVQSLEFVEKVVKYLLLMVEVDCVTTVNYRYMDDYDWTLSFVKNKVPYVLLYREGMLPKNGRGYFDTIDRTKKFGKFHGQLIIVVNNIMKEAFIESGYCYESQIVVGGALRMDNLINRINNKSLSSQSKRKKFGSRQLKHV